MPNLNVQVVTENDKPLPYKKVMLLIHHNFMPDTWLEETTDDDGQADFDVPKFTTVDVYVDGDVEDSGISVGDYNDDDSITIYLGDEEDEDDELDT